MPRITTSARHRARATLAVQQRGSDKRAVGIPRYRLLCFRPHSHRKLRDQTFCKVVSNSRHGDKRQTGESSTVLNKSQMTIAEESLHSVAHKSTTPKPTAEMMAAAPAMTTPKATVATTPKTATNTPFMPVGCSGDGGGSSGSSGGASARPPSFTAEMEMDKQRRRQRAQQQRQRQQQRQQRQHRREEEEGSLQGVVSSVEADPRPSRTEGGKSEQAGTAVSPVQSALTAVPSQVSPHRASAVGEAMTPLGVTERQDDVAISGLPDAVWPASLAVVAEDEVEAATAGMPVLDCLLSSPTGALTTPTMRMRGFSLRLPQTPVACPPSPAHRSAASVMAEGAECEMSPFPARGDAVVAAMFDRDDCDADGGDNATAAAAAPAVFASPSASASALDGTGGTAAAVVSEPCIDTAMAAAAAAAAAGEIGDGDIAAAASTTTDKSTAGAAIAASWSTKKDDTETLPLLARPPRPSTSQEGAGERRSNPVEVAIVPAVPTDVVESGRPDQEGRVVGRDSSLAEDGGEYLYPLIGKDEEVETSTFMPSDLRPAEEGPTRRWKAGDLLCKKLSRAYAVGGGGAAAANDEDGVLGGGAFATVIVAKTRATGTKLAVKGIERTMPEHGDQDKYINRELELLEACCGHPNVVDFLGSIKTTDTVYMIMPLATTDVGILIETDPLPESRVVPIVRQMVSAVQHAHGLNIVHRDLKPANLLVQGDDSILLADFGVAKMLGGDDDLLTGVAGTKPYLAPEQLSELPYNTKADMWAVGVVTFEMLHGRTPFCPRIPNLVPWPSSSTGDNGDQDASDDSMASGSQPVQDSDAYAYALDSGLDGSATVGEVDTDEDVDKRAAEGGAVPDTEGERKVEDGGADTTAYFEELEKQSIISGAYVINADLVSSEAVDFIADLLQVAPEARAPATEASRHPWLGGAAAAAQYEAFVSTKIEESSRKRAAQKAQRFKRAKRAVRRPGKKAAVATTK